MILDNIKEYACLVKMIKVIAILPLEPGNHCLVPGRHVYYIRVIKFHQNYFFESITLKKSILIKKDQTDKTINVSTVWKIN